MVVGGVPMGRRHGKRDGGSSFPSLCLAHQDKPPARQASSDRLGPDFSGQRTERGGETTAARGCHFEPWYTLEWAASSEGLGPESGGEGREHERRMEINTPCHTNWSRQRATRGSGQGPVVANTLQHAHRRAMTVYHISILWNAIPQSTVHSLCLCLSDTPLLVKLWSPRNRPIA